jgi:hypothetical protein
VVTVQRRRENAGKVSDREALAGIDSVELEAPGHPCKLDRFTLVASDH